MKSQQPAGAFLLIPRSVNRSLTLALLIPLYSRTISPIPTAYSRDSGGAIHSHFKRASKGSNPRFFVVAYALWGFHARTPWSDDRSSVANLLMGRLALGAGGDGLFNLLGTSDYGLHDIYAW